MAVNLPLNVVCEGEEAKDVTENWPEKLKG
jgi:hypothetical protein